MKTLEQLIEDFDYKNYIEVSLGKSGSKALAEAIQSQIIEPMNESYLNEIQSYITALKDNDKEIHVLRKMIEAHKVNRDKKEAMIIELKKSLSYDELSNLKVMWMNQREIITKLDAEIARLREGIRGWFCGRCGDHIPNKEYQLLLKQLEALQRSNAMNWLSKLWCWLLYRNKKWGTRMTITVDDSKVMETDGGDIHFESEEQRHE